MANTANQAIFLINSRNKATKENFIEPLNVTELAGKFAEN